MLETEFTENINKLFKENLVFAFICGSYAAGRATPKSDIDMFICTQQPISKNQRTNFEDFYFDLHQKYGFTPDRDFPGEIPSVGDLMDRLCLLNQKKLSLIITDSKYEDGVFWMEMLTDKKVAIINKKPQIFQFFQQKAESFQIQWKNDILNLLPIESRENVSSYDTKELMRRYMQFPSQKPNTKIVISQHANLRQDTSSHTKD